MILRILKFEEKCDFNNIHMHIRRYECTKLIPFILIMMLSFTIKTLPLLDVNWLLISNNMKINLNDNQDRKMKEKKTLLQKINNNLLIMLLRTKMNLDESLNNLKVLRERLDRIVSENNEKRLIYVIYEIKTNKERFYLCKGFSLINDYDYDIDEILHYENANRKKVMKKCGFTEAFDIRNRADDPLIDRDQIYSSKETYKTKDGEINKREKRRKAEYQDDNSNLWKKEYSNSTRSSNGNSDNWNSSVSFSSGASYASSESNTGGEVIRSSLGNKQMPKFDLNFDPSKFGSFKGFN